MLLSLDVSTSCVGYAVFDDSGKLAELSCVKFNDKMNKFEKLEEFNKVTKHLDNLKIDRIAIEEPLEKFKGKFSSSHVIAVLNFFNGMVSSNLYTRFKIKPEYYNVNNARSTVFVNFKGGGTSEQTKYKVWERVMELEPQINWKYSKRTMKLAAENFDMADAYVVGVCDMIIVEKQKKSIVGSV